MTDAGARDSAVEKAAESLVKLNASRPEVAEILAKLVGVVADEAARTPRFAKALTAALSSGSAQPAPKQTRSRRRAPGVIDPFAIYGDVGEDGLRQQLGQLDLEQLRDIIAEHGMDHDRLASKWKTPKRVIGRGTCHSVGDANSWCGHPMRCSRGGWSVCARRWS